MRHYLSGGVGGCRTFTIALDDKSLTDDLAGRRLRVGFSRERQPGDDREEQGDPERAIFTTATNDQVTVLHPCKGVKTPPAPLKLRTIITPEQFAELYRVLPDAQSRLIVETATESGLRWGELTELRVCDIEFATRMLTISGAVVSLNPRFHPSGGRFLVKEYPKDGEYRRFKLSVQITGKLRAHVTERGLGRDDLIFQAPPLDEPRIRKLRLVTDPDSLGRTEPNPQGHTYRHGTMTAYSLGRCQVRLLPRRLRRLPCSPAG
jgi:integrase